MKKIYLLASIALTMMLASCSSDNDEFINEVNPNLDSEEITIAVGMPESDGTRVSFGNDLATLLWNSGDILMCVGRSEGKKIYKSNFDISATVAEDTPTASFSGKVLTDDSYKYEFAYCGGKFSASRVTYDYENNEWNCQYLSQEDAKFNNFEHLANHLFMISDPISRADLKKGTPVVMHQKSAIMKVNVQDYADVFLQGSNGAISTNEFNVNLYFNYVEGGDNVAVSTVKLINNYPLKTDNFLYIAFDPTVVLSQGGVIALEFMDKADPSIKCIARGTSANGKSYVAGKVYTLTVGKEGKNLIWDKKKETTKEDLFTTDKTPEIVLFDFTQEDPNGQLWGFNAKDKDNALFNDILSFDNAMSIKSPYQDIFLYVSSSPITLKGVAKHKGNAAKGLNKLIVQYNYNYFSSIKLNENLKIQVRDLNASGRSFKWRECTPKSAFPGKVGIDNIVEFDISEYVYGKNVEIAFVVKTNVGILNIKKMSVRGEDAK